MADALTRQQGPQVGAPDAWGNDVAGRCPACRGSSLFVAVGGYVTCRRMGCPDPTAVADLLESPALPHLHRALTAQRDLLSDLANGIAELARGEGQVWLGPGPDPDA